MHSYLFCYSLIDHIEKCTIILLYKPIPSKPLEYIDVSFWLAEPPTEPMKKRNDVTERPLFRVQWRHWASLRDRSNNGIPTETVSGLRYHVYFFRPSFQ